MRPNMLRARGASGAPRRMPACPVSQAQTQRCVCARHFATATKRFQAIPKVELHRHLEGAVRATTVLAEAQRHGVSLPHGPGAVLTPPEGLTLEGLRPHIQSLDPFPNLASLLSIFDHTQSTLCDGASFHRIAKEAVLDAYAEGIRVLELRYAPSFASMNHGHSFDMVLDSIKAGIDEAHIELGVENRIGVGLLCIGVGAMGEEEMERTVSFLLERKSDFVGFDMAGAEQEVLRFAPFFKRVRDAGIPITCHASEDLEDGKPQNAVDAVQILGAERIGHGVQIIHDRSAMDAIRDSGVLLEVSVTSKYLLCARAHAVTILMIEPGFHMP